MKNIIILLLTLFFLSSCESKIKNMNLKGSSIKKEKIQTQKNINKLYDGFIIQRRIEGTPFFHFGVVKDDKIIHYDQMGVHESTLNEFAKGLPVKVVSDKVNDIKDNLSIVEKYRGSKYDMMKNNCEHFAYELVFKEKISLQTDKSLEYLQKSAPVMENYLMKKNPQDSLEIKMVFDLLNKNIN